jgi:hypothetical protein
MIYFLGTCCCAWGAILWRVGSVRIPRLGRRVEPIFIFTGRILAGTPELPIKYRFTYLVQRSSYVEAEELAQAHLATWMESRRNELGTDFQVRWIKGRVISDKPHLHESESVLQLLKVLPNQNNHMASAIDRMETAGG